jgi:hypothetical protein
MEFYPGYNVGMDIDRGCFLLLCWDGYWHWTLRLGMFFLLRRDGYWHYDLWFFMLFWTMTDITKYHKLWPRIVTKASSLSFPQRWRVLPCKCNIVFLCVLDTNPPRPLRSGVWSPDIRLASITDFMCRQADGKTLVMIFY